MSAPRWQGEMRVKFERLEALYHGHGPVHCNGELYEIVDVRTAHISRVGSRLETAKEVSAEELD